MADLSRLFEARLGGGRRRAPYRTLAAELDAVRAGAKALSMFPLARPGREPEDDAFLAQLLRAAEARGLSVLVEPGEPGELAGAPPGVTAYALPLAEAWRVPALAALFRAAREEGAWSDAAERQLSALLGYSARERRAWLAELRWSVAAWGAKTVYALLDAEARARAARLGRRCFGEPAEVAGMVLFAHAGGHALRRDAAQKAPRGVVIARAGIAPAAFARVFGRGGERGHGGGTGPVLEVIATARTAAVITDGLCSNVELLSAGGWR